MKLENFGGYNSEKTVTYREAAKKRKTGKKLRHVRRGIDSEQLPRLFL